MNRRGFSLIELVMVVVLIGAVAAIMFPRIGPALNRRSVDGARVAVTALNAKAKALAVQRGRAVSLVRDGNRYLVISQHPVTGAIDTVDRQNLFERFKVTLDADRNTLVYDPRGIGLQGSTTNIVITRAGYADTLRISAIGSVMR